MAQAQFRLRIAKAILGTHAKELIPALNPLAGLDDGSGRLRTYVTKQEQLTANLGWSYAANKAIVDDCASVPLKLFRKKSDGDKEEIKGAHPILDLLANPNNAHTGEQMAQLHYTYMNFNGEAYTMMFRNGLPWTPNPGQLPQALQEIPAHLCTFKLSDDGYSKSTVKFNNQIYPLSVFVRDINPDPSYPYNGQSIIAAAASIINTDNQMREWNNNLMANGARPGLVFTTNEEMSTDAYERWKQQHGDEHTGAMNAGKSLLIEGGDVKPYMLSPQDLDFLESRKFTMNEILAMWKVSPYKLGLVESVNKASAEIFDRKHAKDNTEPRVRQWVHQLNVTVVQNLDPTLELGYENPVPEDVEAKLAVAEALTNKVYTIDEVRDMYGELPLPNKLGEQIYILNTNAPLKSVADGSAKPQPATTPGGAPEPDATGTDDPKKDGMKSLEGVKKNS